MLILRGITDYARRNLIPDDIMDLESMIDTEVEISEDMSSESEGIYYILIDNDICHEAFITVEYINDILL